MPRRTSLPEGSKNWAPLPRCRFGLRCWWRARPLLQLRGLYGREHYAFFPQAALIQKASTPQERNPQAAASGKPPPQAAKPLGGGSIDARNGKSTNFQSEKGGSRKRCCKQWKLLVRNNRLLHLAHRREMKNDEGEVGFGLGAGCISRTGGK